MNGTGPPAPEPPRVEALERRIAEQERALDELRTDVALLVGKIHAVLDLLAGRRAS